MPERLANYIHKNHARNGEAGKKEKETTTGSGHCLAVIGSRAEVQNEVFFFFQKRQGYRRLEAGWLVGTFREAEWSGVELLFKKLNVVKIYIKVARKSCALEDPI